MLKMGRFAVVVEAAVEVVEAAIPAVPESDSVAVSDLGSDSGLGSGSRWV
jgi:hypothetical protein